MTTKALHEIFTAKAGISSMDRHSISDMAAHFNALREYASDCNVIHELGVREIGSSWAFLKGLSEKGNAMVTIAEDRRRLEMSPITALVSIDHVHPDKFAGEGTLAEFQKHAAENNVHHEFIESSSLDVHIDLEKGEATIESKDGSKETIKIGEGMSKAEQDKLNDEIKNSLIQSAKAAESSSAGNIPAGLERLITDITAPKLDWRQMLRTSIKSQIKNNYTWTRPSRKMYSTNAVLPGLDVDNELDVHISIDTSGSIDQEMLRDFLGEVNGIKDEFDDYKIRVWCFDTEVHADETFETWDGKELEDYAPAGYDLHHQCSW